MNVNVSYFANMDLAEGRDNNWEVDESKMAQSLSRALKAIRKQKKLSLNQVSEGTDIPFQTIARYETGENIPSVIQAYKLAFFYQFSVNDMFLIGLFETDDLEEIIENWKESPQTTKIKNSYTNNGTHNGNVNF